MMTSKPLCPPEREVLQNWKMPFLPLAEHAQLELEARNCMEGIGSAILIGPRGVGKTESLRWLRNKLEGEEVEASFADPAYQIRPVLYYEASKATGPKTALIDLYESVADSLSMAARRLHSPKSLIGAIADELKVQHIRLVIIDEAQLIDAPNLDLLRQVPDRARELGHECGLLLAGSEELHRSLASIKQLGQRFSAKVELKPLTAGELMPELPRMHPHLPSVKQELSKGAWKALEEKLYRVAGGNLRRLTTVLRNANVLALMLDRWLDDEVLALAMGKLAEES